jgi:hypothetical protein
VDLHTGLGAGTKRGELGCFRIHLLLQGTRRLAHWSVQQLVSSQQFDDVCGGCNCGPWSSAESEMILLVFLNVWLKKTSVWRHVPFGSLPAVLLGHLFLGSFVARIRIVVFAHVWSKAAGQEIVSSHFQTIVFSVWVEKVADDILLCCKCRLVERARVCVFFCSSVW